MILLGYADLLAVARAALRFEPPVRDHGVIEAAAARPGTTLFGEEAYPDVWLKAAALLHSLAKGHPLVDGNKRLSWLSARVLLDLNGVPAIPVPVDDAEELVVDVAAGRLTEVTDIATALRALYEAAAAGSN